MHRTPLALVALALVFPATADAKSCSTDVPGAGNLTAKNVGCSKARKVMEADIGGVKSPFGFTCKSTRYEGGSTRTCKKGADKRVRYQIAD